MFYPIKLAPCYQNYLWGGDRLRTEYGKTDAPSPAAESWELAFHHDGCCHAAEGALKGKTLGDLATLNRNGFWGTDCWDPAFPLLVKLIDAKRDLSIQVHPSETTALTTLGEQGKAEMWYVVDSQPRACLYYGFSKKISASEFLCRARDGTICDVLNQVPVKRGDVFYILPGTVHAIGAGILIAEIQQNSNTTFRIYDYMRRDAAGSLRPLHLDRAVQVVNYTPLVPVECRVNNCVCFPEFTMAEMFSCPYFRAYRFDIHARAALRCDGKSFQHLLFVSGEGQICYEGHSYRFRQGDSFFLPAALDSYTVEGNCRMLLSRV